MLHIMAEGGEIPSIDRSVGHHNRLRKEDGPNYISPYSEGGPNYNGPYSEDGPNYNGPYSDPVYKQISLSNGEVNRMKLSQLREHLSKYQLDTRGVKEVLKKRLKNFYKIQKLSKACIESPIHRQTPYDYLVVIDYEATCEESNGSNFPHEIIEFPAVLINTSSQLVVSEFHEYCCPQMNSKLSPFCTELTGITQAVIDEADPFPLVLHRMELWLSSFNQNGTTSFAIVTDGPWDMSRFMHKQCQTSEIKFPKWARRWVNIRKTFRNFYGFRKANLKSMLENLGLVFLGTPHSGIDDARNIARVTCEIMMDGCCVHVNEKLFSYKLQENSEVLCDVLSVSQEDELSGKFDADDDEKNIPVVKNTRPKQPTSAHRNGACRPVFSRSQVIPKSVREKQLEEVNDIIKNDDNIEDLMFYMKLQDT